MRQEPPHLVSGFLSARFERALRELEIARNDGEEVVEIMCHAAGELAERLEFLNLEQLFARLRQFGFGFAAIRHVARDLGESDKLALRVADRIDDHACPKTGPVLAHAPALLLVAPRQLGRRERLLRRTRRTIFRRVERADVPADDFMRGVALDPLGAPIPAGDDSFWIEQIDGIIDDALDEQLELLRILDEGIPRRALCRR